jgi:hypothetical protein
MVISSLLNDPAHWRRRAQETRSIADRLNDPIAKQTMLEIAQLYEQLAAIAKTRLIAGKQS